MKWYLFKINLKLFVRNPKRYIRMRIHLQKVFKDNAEILNRLGSDYDKNGNAYWDKYGQSQ